MSHRITKTVCVACGLFAVLLQDPPESAAQVVVLGIAEGRATLNADKVPLHSILEEWTRVTGTVFVNGDELATVPMTLTLESVPERDALAVLLREVPGYIVLRHPQTGGINRVLILPKTSVSRDAVVRAGQPSPFPPAPGAVESDDSPPEELIVGAATAVAGERTSDNAVEAAVQLVDGANPETVTPPAQRPPTPILRQSPAPASASAIGSPLGSPTPGVITPTGPPPGFVDPPVTSPESRRPPIPAQ